VYWTFDRAPAGSVYYLYTEWESARMQRVGAREWTGTIPTRKDAKTVDVLTMHRTPVDGQPFFISSPYTRLSLG
jgi:hypothetical protein